MQCTQKGDQASLISAGQPIMLPLTSSVYVNGTLASNETVLIDIGTGYYIEASHPPSSHQQEAFVGLGL